MSFFQDQELDKLRSLIDIVQVIGEKIPLKKSGHNFKGLCPFHTEKTPSFMVHPEKQIYHCFGCGEGGDAFSFLMKFEGLEFPESVERLAERYGVVLSRGGNSSEGEGEVRRQRGEKELLFQINQLALRFFYETLMNELAGRRGRDYLKERGIRSEMSREAHLGYAPADGKGLSQRLAEKKAPMELALKLGLVRQGDAGDCYDFFRDRLIFGVVSGEGKVLGFSGRALEDSVQPKYLNSPESVIYHKSDSFLGMQAARNPIREQDRAILVEGNFDLVRLHQEGILNAVAPLGTSLTDKQVVRLVRQTQNFLLLFDGDDAGLRAAFRSLELFLPLGIAPRVVLLPKADDPDSFVRREGVGALKGLMEQAPSLLDYRIDQIFQLEGGTPQGQSRAVEEIGKLLALLPGKFQKMIYLQRVAQRTGLSEGLLERELFQKKGANLKKGRNFLPHPVDEEKRRLPPIERTVLELLLSGSAKPDLLFQEIDLGDFSDKDLGLIWAALKEDYARQGSIEPGRILNALPEETDPGTKRLVTELTLRGSRWKEEGSQVATDCLRQIRVTKIKDRLKDLSSEIRRAETEQDGIRMRDLLDQKGRLLKDMSSFH